MKQTLVIGSTVADVILSLPRLPRRGEDINIGPPVCRLGGCAYEVGPSIFMDDTTKNL
jgi:hypothetical protein